MLYSGNTAIREVDLDIAAKEITAFIGPSGCGKTTVLRVSQPHARHHAGRAGARVSVMYHGEDLYGPKVDAAEVRRRIGMVFQKPNPFPKTIFDNVAYGPRINGRKRKRDRPTSSSTRSTRAALWDEVKDKLKQSGLSLSGGQQQRLCIARAIAVEPDVVLMDEPCSALDPIATARIEDLMEELKRDFTIVIVTHNMQQAARVSDRTAFFTAEVDDDGRRVGRLVEFDDTEKLFTAPERSPHRGLHHGTVRLISGSVSVAGGRDAVVEPSSAEPRACIEVPSSPTANHRYSPGVAGMSTAHTTPAPRKKSARRSIRTPPGPVRRAARRRRLPES